MIGSYEAIIRVAIFHPDADEPIFKNIDNTLEPMQQIVGGHIERVSISADGLIVICNETFLIERLPPNRAYCQVANGNFMSEMLCGPFFVCREVEPEMASIRQRDEAPLLRWKRDYVWYVNGARAVQAGEKRA